MLMEILLHLGSLTRLYDKICLHSLQACKHLTNESMDKHKRTRPPISKDRTTFADHSRLRILRQTP